jgi:16S rRNA (guanine966-N2)-methyltransferase
VPWQHGFARRWIDAAHNEGIVRVIAGKFRRRKLQGPGALALWLRPTSDRLRETLFNILGPEIEDSLFVDVCAGTGAMGIEALSRGAREAVFIEGDARAAKLVRQNLESLGIRDGAQLLETDALAGLKQLSARRAMADFVYVDPPYEDVEEHLRILEYLDASHLIAPRGLVLVEHHWKTSLPERFNRLERARMVEQGETMVSFYGLAAAA